MRKKLLAGVMALALCSTNMPPQTIFAQEFTSGNPEEVSEVFTDTNQESAEEELSVFASESVPEFSSETNIAPATTDVTESTIDIDLTDPTNSEYYDAETGRLEIYKINGGGSYRFKGSGNINSPTTVPIRIRTSRETNIYLNNVYIVADLVPALDIQTYNIVNIYLENNNFLETQNSNSYESALKMEFSLPTIYSQNNNGSLTVSSTSGTGIRIGSGSLTINGGSVTASSSSGTGIDIGRGSLTIKSGSVTASSTSGTGIKSNSLTIEDGSVKASSTLGTGIESGSLTINGGSVTASSANETEKGISSNQITINGGSVKASSVSSSPKNTQGDDVYCCTIENPKSEAVIIDRNPTSWEPKNHQAVDPLYAWLTGETHTISVGNTTQTYYFDKNNNNNEFKPITNRNFTFTKPSNLTYDGTAQKAPLECNIEDIKDEIKLSYYNKDDGQQSDEAINAGTYTVTANIAGNSFADESWTFTIKPRNLNISIDDIERKYGEDNPKLTYLIFPNTPLVANDTTDSLGITLTTTADKDAAANTTWPITMNYTTKNYTINATPGKLSIKPATFNENSIIITAYSETYDGSEHSVIKEISGYPAGSKVEYSTETGTPNWNTTCPKVKNVSDSKKTKVRIRISKDNYESWVSDEIQATIFPAKIANLPLNPQMSVPWTCKKVADITTNLPTNWNWQDSSKDLQEGSNSVIAVYTGPDAGEGNYERETVDYTITRSKCTHEHTAGRYYSSPSCTSSGYSGDTYCTDCNETISYGYTISAYGHDYDSGVITTEPTTETDGIITYTCKRCQHQDTKNLGKLGDGEPYIEGSFQKKGWDAVNDLIKASKEKDTISITLNGAKVLPASVLSEIKGKDISLSLDMENGFIWKINGTSITSETPADTDLSVTNTAEYIPAALYSLISTNQNDFGFHLGRSGAFDFPAVLSVKADASCAGLMANLFWYDVENGVLQCIQTVTVGGAFERSIPYADFTLSKGQDYFMAFGTESLNGRVIHTDGSITDENGAYLRPADTKISSHSIDRNKLTVKLSKGCAGAQGYDFVISKKSNMLQTGKFSKTVSSAGKPQASFRYLAKGTWYVAARSWVLDAQGNKVYGSWTKIKKIKITVVTPQQPKIRNITVKGNTVTVIYTKCKNATGYEILLGNKYKTSAGEKYPVKKHLKRTGNTTTVTFTNVKKGTWYVTIRAWNQTSKDKSRVYSPYSSMKKFKTKK